MDHISNLPDAIISYILSFLSTKSAVKTCILSKRWQYVWTKVPALDITEMPHSRRYLSDEQQIHFKNFVNKVLLQNDVSCLQCFTLRTYSEYDYDCIESWLRAVEGREFCELNVKLHCPRTFYLPRQFLSGQKLVVLKLEGFMISNMGHSFHLPNLEIIHLVSVLFDGDLFLKSLVLDCTALKELLIDGCYGFEETLYVESSTLESLEIKECMIKECAIDRSNYVLPFIRIQTPNLRYLSLQDALANYNIGELKLLTEANLDLWDSEGYDEIEHLALQLIEKISGVKSL
ncbi:putative F-box protein At1g58310 [Chenopodium quinoa]|uniref:putative F-box protein At1g58310 n=1 Tax=Chenopodium quinoa TaxID=63459 RepID=UPI000B78732F|nr:putative F-box protein At1g58310 [Chenopodium quinoa]XP_021743823.1 putative F-box protein At1g58310 [Chenopodium quinoa]XP_021743824.1 putative F-box protein At1g58310 [Chenopodium quinoa]